MQRFSNTMLLKEISDEKIKMIILPGKYEFWEFTDAAINNGITFTFNPDILWVCFHQDEVNKVAEICFDLDLSCEIEVETLKPNDLINSLLLRELSLFMEHRNV